MAKPNRALPSLTKQDIKRFWGKINKAPGQGPWGDCWEWTAGKKGQRWPYGQFGLNRKTYYAHRLSYFLQFKIDPIGHLVCHKCDNPPCCNPSHFFLGANGDNSTDAKVKGRMAAGDRNGTRTQPKSRACGERQGGSKLTEALVLEARQRFSEANPKPRYSDIAKEYGVSTMTMFHAINKNGNRGTWKHI